MFRRTTKSVYVRTAATLFAVSICSLAAAQNAGSTAQGQAQQIDPKLWQLLADWSKASSGISKLSGKHQRHIYDNTFGIEKISTGEFWYESPDKGRIDVSPVKITPQMLQAREQPDAQVRRKGGKPYKLQSDDAERWLCDGKDVYDIDDTAKEARVAPLPPQLRGENIMNSPLPFLFGLPPERAVKRFKMELVKDYRPKYQVVQLKAFPLLRSDAANWSSAEILLDTSTFLPTAVKLIDPPETGESVYKFSDLEVNKNGWFGRMIGKNPWDPKLKGYRIDVIEPQQPPAAAPIAQQGGAGSQIMVPSVVGMHYKQAQAALSQAGIPKERIRQLRGGPAPNVKQTFYVKAQEPQPNAVFDAKSGVTLMIYEQAKTASAGGGSASSTVRN